MRTRIALASAIVASAAAWTPAAHGQLFGGRKPTTTPTKPAPAATPAGKVDKMFLPSSVTLPGPSVEVDDKLGVPLPEGPIEPYLLTKDNGPFMVLACTFDGPDAPRKALAVVLELRKKHNMPAYILLAKDFPGGSNIRNVPPQAELAQKVPVVGMPEAIRTQDEAAVMVGNEKTVEDSVKLMKRIKHLELDCFKGGTSRTPFRKGKELARAIRTTNPFIPAELLFAQKPDVMLGQMNGGPHNIMNCPGRYSLQVAEFTGRSVMDPDKDTRFQNILSLKKSPLETAADDAEKLAEALSKDKEVQKVGVRAYVYHDRYASRVMVGSFQAPTDPAVKQVHDQMLRLAYDLPQRKVTDVLIVPATNLTDLTPIKTSIQAGTAAQSQARR